MFKRFTKTLKESQAFTLLEMLMALWILSLSLILIHSTFMNLIHIQDQLEHSKQAEWHIFLHQLPYEAEGYYLASASKRKLLFKGDGINKDRHASMDITHRNRALIRRVSYRGHQPLLTDIKHLSFQALSERVVLIQVSFHNGEHFEARVRFAPAPGQEPAGKEDSSE